MSIGFPAQFRRLNPILLDDSQVQSNLAAFQAYLAGGTAVPGQVVSVGNGTNVPDVFVVNEDRTYTQIAVGADGAVPWSEYAQDTEFRQGHFVVFGNRLFAVKQTFTSDDTEPTVAESLDKDIADGHLMPAGGAGEAGDATQVEMGTSFVAQNSPIAHMNGKTISMTDDVASIIKQMLRPTVPPTYLAPTLTLAGSSPNAGGIEYGTSISPTLTPTFNQRDGGALSEYRLLRNGTPIYTGAAASAMADLPAFNISAVTTYTAQADFGIGPVKNDSEGDPDPTGQIQAGTVNSGNVVYTPQFRWFAGALTANTPLTTSDQIRALPQTGLNPQNGTNIPVNVTSGAGHMQIVFAYPAVLRVPISIMTSAFPMDLKGSFVETIIPVNDASGGNPTNYRILFLTPAIPFETDVYTMTI